MEEDGYWSGLQHAVGELVVYSKTFEDFDEAYSERLRSFEKAVESESDLEIEPWLGIQVEKFFGFEDYSYPNAQSRTLDKLEVIPKILVFLPIVWTWLCLARASSAFSKLIANEPEAAGTPFLTLWHRNFDGYLGFEYSFERFALGAVFSVLAIVFSIVALHFIEDRLLGHSNQLATTRVKKLKILTSELERQLNRHRLHSPARFVEELTSAAKSIRVLHTNAATVLSNISNLSQVTDDSADKIQNSTLALTQQLVGLEEKMIQATQILDSIQGAEIGLTKLYTELPIALDSLIRRTESQISQDLTQPLSEMRQVLETVENYERMQIHAVEQLAHFISVAFPDVKGLKEDLLKILENVQVQKDDLSEMKNLVKDSLEKLRTDSSIVTETNSQK